jgi:hypothetical protein
VYAYTCCVRVCMHTHVVLLTLPYHHSFSLSPLFVNAIDAALVANVPVVFTKAAIKPLLPVVPKVSAFVCACVRVCDVRVQVTSATTSATATAAPVVTPGMTTTQTLPPPASATGAVTAKPAPTAREALSLSTHAPMSHARTLAHAIATAVTAAVTTNAATIATTTTTPAAGA